MAEFDIVWNLPSILAAAAAALLSAVFVIMTWFRHPPTRNSAGTGLLVGVSAAICAALFTASQVAAAFWTNDREVIRIASRYGMWCVFSAVLGVAVWAELRHRGLR